MASRLDVVIAHYNEDLSWLEDGTDCVIYSKGGEKNAPALPHEKLPNIGREGHTYLHHIIEQYDTLADFTIFLQGKIDDHIPLDLDEIKKRALATEPGAVTTFPYRELESFEHWDGIPWDDYPSWKKWTSMKCVKAARTPGAYWQIFFPGRDIPHSVGFPPGALFAVRKEEIHQYPKSFYELVMKEFFLGDMESINPETGHFMERFWLSFFSPSEYICWDPVKDISKSERNSQGQLAKGRWHVTPKYVDVDLKTIQPKVQITQ